VPYLLKKIVEFTSLSIAVYFIIIELIATIGIIGTKMKGRKIGSHGYEIILNFLSPVMIIVCQTIYSY